MKKIEFIHDASFSPTLEPVPASSVVPQWYRDGEMFIHKHTQLKDPENEEDRVAGMRACMPFFDALMSGYMLRTWWDVEITKNTDDVVEFQYIEQNVDGVWVKTPEDKNMIKERHGDIGHTLPRPAGHSNNHMVWQGKWGVRLPKGWSLIYTHPLNQFQLPFTSSSAILDSDRFVAHGNLPFFLKEGWVGIIPKGTPIIQLIPVKRSVWVGIFKTIRDVESEHFAKAARSVAYGFYRSVLWTPKKFSIKK